MNKHVIALRVLRDRDEQVVDGAVWMKCADIKQFKVSPLGLHGDYDTGAFWVDFDALEEHFAGNFCGQTTPEGRLCVICGTAVYGPSGDDAYTVHIGCKKQKEDFRKERLAERAAVVERLLSESIRLDSQTHEDEESYQRCRARAEALRDAAEFIAAGLHAENAS